jgi:hypothetical protein
MIDTETVYNEGERGRGKDETNITVRDTKRKRRTRNNLRVKGRKREKRTGKIRGGGNWWKSVDMYHISPKSQAL